jgi:hypothetical protein
MENFPKHTQICYLHFQQKYLRFTILVFSGILVIKGVPWCRTKQLMDYTPTGTTFIARTKLRWMHRTILQGNSGSEDPDLVVDGKSKK